MVIDRSDQELRHLRDPFDPRTATEAAIMARAEGLVGHPIKASLSQFKKVSETPRGDKGGFGLLVERYFNISQNSDSAPDFTAAAIELKSVPLMRRSRAGGFRAKERTTVSMIDFHALVGERWETASVRPKLAQILFVFFEFCEPPEDIPLLVAGWSLLALFATGLSLCIAALTEKTELFDRIWHTITYLLFPFSGAGTLLDWLPPGARKALLYLPFAHGVEMIRHGYYGSSIRTHEDWQYLLYVSLVLVFVGIAAIESVAREVEPE